MTQDDKEFLKEFLRGGATVGVVLGLFILFIAMLSGGNDKTPLLEPHAEVVDTYKGCDIVRWNSHEFAEYKYFLYCGETK